MKIRCLMSLGLLVAGGAMLSAAAPATPVASAAAATKADPIAVIQMDRYRTRWSIDAVVAGRKGKFIFDSGGGVTLISPEFMKASGCELWGRSTGFNMFAKRGDGPRCEGLPIEIGGRKYTPAMVGVINLGALNPKDAELDGLISLSLFENQLLTLDLASGRIIVESEASFAERTRSMKPLPVRVSHEVGGLATAVNVGIKTAKGTVWMELDSGNGGTVLVSKPYAELFGLDPNKEGKQNVEFDVVPGVRFKTSDAFTPDLIIDGNLGMPFLRDWIISVDLKESRGWIGPAARPAGS